jgi:hypothetical protein
VNEAKADLGKGYTRKYLTTLLEDTTTGCATSSRKKSAAPATARPWGCRCSACRPTCSTRATAKMPAEARDEVAYEAEGYMRGRNGFLEAIPEGTPPRFHQAVLRGFEKGQEATQEDFLAGLQAEPGTAAADNAERKSVARAKASLAKMGEAANKVAA